MIKSERKDVEQKETFPKLMITPNEKVILLVASKDALLAYRGTVLHSKDSTYTVGNTYVQWHGLEDYTGEITLKNEF